MLKLNICFFAIFKKFLSLVYLITVILDEGQGYWILYIKKGQPKNYPSPINHTKISVSPQK